MGRSGARAAAAMDPFLVLLHSVSAGLSDDELTELKFLCRGRVGKRKLESVRCGLDLFTVLLEQNELDAEHTELLRELLVSLRRQDLLQRLDGFEAGAAGRAPPEERGGRAARGAGRGGGSRGPGRAVRPAVAGAGPPGVPFPAFDCADFLRTLAGGR